LTDEIIKVNNSKKSLWLIPLIILISLTILFFIKKRKDKTNINLEDEDELLEQIYQIIKKEKRTTQKDLRKKLPYSEAKISLVLSELENKGKIEKIKKGRSNIIILKN
jgi:uncharacterized membrane protein